MKARSIFRIFLFLGSVNFAFAALAHASLGDDESSVQKDAVVLNTTSTVTSKTNFHQHEMLAHATHIHEFSDTSGKVFGVAWSGANHPDLKTLLGSYYPEFQNAYVLEKQKHHHGGVINISTQNLHIEMGGRMMALYGHVYLPNQTPSEVDVHAIK